MNDYSESLDKLLRHMPSEVYKPLRDFIYDELYNAKLKTNAIELVSPNSTESQRMQNPTYADIKTYKEFLSMLKEFMNESRGA